MVLVNVRKQSSSFAGKRGTHLLGPCQPRCPCVAAVLPWQDWPRTSAGCRWWCSVCPRDWATRQASTHRRVVAERSAGRSGCRPAPTTGPDREEKSKHVNRVRTTTTIGLRCSTCLQMYKHQKTSCRHVNTTLRWGLFIWEMRTADLALFFNTTDTPETNELLSIKSRPRFTYLLALVYQTRIRSDSLSRRTRPQLLPFLESAVFKNTNKVDLLPSICFLSTVNC